MADSSGIADRLLGGYQSLGQGDFESVLEVLDPDVEVRDRPESPDAGVYHGHEGARRAFEQTSDIFDEVEMVPEEVFERGDQFVVVLLLRASGRESGIPVEERIAHHWTVRDGRGVKLQVYSDPADALAAAGIDP